MSIDPSLQNALNTDALLMQAINAPRRDRLDAHTLDVVERVIIDRRSKTRHTADAKAVSLVLGDVQRLRPTPTGDDVA